VCRRRSEEAESAQTKGERIVIIRQATAQDWPLIYPIYAAIMAEGKTYAFPDGQSLAEARPWWMEEPPSQAVVAMSGGEIVGSAKMGANRPGGGSHVATASFIDRGSFAAKGVRSAAIYPTMPYFAKAI
jgi:hypothetical protein